MLPGGVYLIGGGTKLANIVEVAKKELRLPACLGTNNNVATIIDKANETEFLNALGLVVWGSQAIRNGGLSLNIPGSAVVNKSWQKIKKWFSSLIP